MALTEAFFAPGIGARVALRVAVYHKAPDAESRGFITVDGVDVWDAAYFSYFPVERVEMDLRRAEIDYDDQNWPRRVWDLQRSVGESLGERGIMDRWTFIRTLEEYCETGVDESLQSKNVLTRALAMVDRRLGKRRLKNLDMANEHPLVATLYRVRMETIAKGTKTRRSV